MVDGTGLENQQINVSQVRILSLPPSSETLKNKPTGLNFLATVFEAWVFALVAVFVIIVAVLFCNRFHSDFSCHRWIITCLHEN